MLSKPFPLSVGALAIDPTLARALNVMGKKKGEQRDKAHARLVIYSYIAGLQLTEQAPKLNKPALPLLEGA